MAKDLALRIGDFVQIKRDDLPDLSQEAPIQFDVVTEKEEVLAKGHLSGETAELLKAYLPTIKCKTNPYLFPTNGKHGISEEAVSWNLKELAHKAGIAIPKGKRLSFHAFRKLFISTGKNLNVDPDIIKALCGKSVAASILTYMTTVQWRENFAKIAAVLKIQEMPNKNHVKLEELEAKTLEQNRLIANLTMTLDAFKQELQEVKESNAQTKAELETYAELLPEEIRESFKKHVTQIRMKSKRT
jgi:hypothetical protein